MMSKQNMHKSLVQYLTTRIQIKMCSGTSTEVVCVVCIKRELMPFNTYHIISV